MRELLYKDIRMVLHPTCIIFLSFAAMLFIPSYPYTVACFYTTLTLFFVCLTARENHDIDYMMMLPIQKKDIVKSRILLFVCIEMANFILTAIVVVIRCTVCPYENQGGMVPNLVLLGIYLLMYGTFNYVFLTGHYKDVSKVGKPFLLGSILMFLFVALEEIIMIAQIVMRQSDKNVTLFLNEMDGGSLMKQLPILLGCIVLYVLLNITCYKVSVKRLEVQDL